MDDKDLAVAGAEFFWNRIKESVQALVELRKKGQKKKEEVEGLKMIDLELSAVLQDLLSLSPDLSKADALIQRIETLSTKPKKLALVVETRERVIRERGHLPHKVASKKPGQKLVASKKASAKKPAAKKAAPKKAAPKKAAKK